MISLKTQNVWLLILLVVSMLLASCSQDHSQQLVKIKHKVEVDSKVEDKIKTDIELTFAILSNASAQETYRTYYNFIRYFEEQLSVKVNIIQKNTYSEILNVFQSGKADIGIVSGYLSVIGDQKGIMERIVMPVINGNKQYSSYIITRKDTDITTIQDFKGKKFASSNPHSFAGYLLPKYLVDRQGYNIDQFFKKIYFTYSHDHSFLSVVNGLVDGAAIYSITYDKLLKENDSDAENIQVIARSALIGNHPIVVNPSIHAGLKEKIKKIFLSMHKYDEGQVVLEEVNYDYFLPIDEELYLFDELMLEEMDEPE